MKQLKRLYGFILARPILFWSHVILMLVASVLGLSRSFFLGWITNAATGGALGTVFSLIITFGLILIVSLILENLAHYLMDRNLVEVSTAISKKVMAKVHELDFSFHADKSSGKLISLFRRGDDAVFNFYVALNDDLLIFGVSLVVMLIAFSRLGLLYGFLVFLFMLMSCVAGYFILKANLKAREKWNRVDDEFGAVKTDNLVNFDTVKYFAQEKFEQRRLAKVLLEWKKALLKFHVTFRVFDIVIFGLCYLFLIVIGVTAGRELQLGTMTLGNFVIILSFVISVMPSIVHVMYIVRSMAKTVDDLNKYLGLLDEKVKVPDPSKSKMITNYPGVILFNQVSFTYQTKTPVIQDFNLEVRAGEAVALVGFSGAGKTTIAKLLMRMYDVDVGKITIDGVDLREMNKDYLRSLVGVVPQEPVMFNNTVYYNIAYSKPQAKREEVVRAAKLAQIDTFIDRLADGYETIVGERGIKLSGGQRQRLAIARVLLMGVQIVIFDEATSSLDSQAEKMVQEAFWRMAKDQNKPVTSLIIAHRLSTIMLADRIVVVDQGTVKEIGTHRQLLANHKSIYTKLWTMQQDGFIGDGESLMLD
jgi:ATP-binding cassette subfamily B protein